MLMSTLESKTLNFHNNNNNSYSCAATDSVAVHACFYTCCVLISCEKERRRFTFGGGTVGLERSHVFAMLLESDLDIPFAIQFQIAFCMPRSPSAPAHNSVNVLELRHLFWRRRIRKERSGKEIETQGRSARRNAQ